MEEDGESDQSSAGGIDQEPSFDSDGERVANKNKSESVSSSEQEEDSESS